MSQLTSPPSFSPAVLDLDVVQETERITQTIRDQVARRLRRKGAVVGLSGGIDSSVVAALCGRALGPDLRDGFFSRQPPAGDRLWSGPKRCI